MTVAPTTATTPVPTSTYPTEGAEPNRTALGYTTAPLANGFFVDNNSIPQTATITTAPLTIDNTKKNRDLIVCADGSKPSDTSFIGGKTQNSNPTSSGVDNSLLHRDAFWFQPADAR